MTSCTVICHETFLVAGVMALLRPLLLDMRPNIQYMAAMALGRLAENSADLAAGVVTGDILPQVIYGIARNAVSG